MQIARRLISMLAVSALVTAQSGQRSGIEGFVTSDVAEAISGATIGIESATRGFHLQTATNPAGYYLMEDLNPGAYSVWAEVKGVGCIIYPNLPLLPGKRIRQDFHFVRAKPNPKNCQPVARHPK